MYLESLQGLKDLRVPLRLSALMREAGFVDVESRMIALHTCGWSTGALSSQIYAPLLTTGHIRSTRERNWHCESRKRPEISRIVSIISFDRKVGVNVLNPLASSVVLKLWRRMAIQDVQLLVARARLEADNPAFKARPQTEPIDEPLTQPGLFSSVCVHRQEIQGKTPIACYDVITKFLLAKGAVKEFRCGLTIRPLVRSLRHRTQCRTFFEVGTRTG